MRCFATVLKFFLWVATVLRVCCRCCCWYLSC